MKDHEQGEQVERAGGKRLPEMVQKALSSSGQPFAAANHHLLLVDDDPAIRGLTKLELEGIGCRVTTASNADEALCLADEFAFSLVILDIIMPHADGLSLLETLKQRHPQLPVLILTGMGFEQEAMREALAKGADGYVSKGLTISHLVMEIHRILRQPRPA